MKTTTQTSKATEAKTPATDDAAVYALIRSIMRGGHYGPSFSCATYDEAKARGLIRWEGDGYVVTT